MNNTIIMNLYLTESVWNTSELVFKIAHKAHISLLGRLFVWAGIFDSDSNVIVSFEYVLELATVGYDRLRLC